MTTRPDGQMNIAAAFAVNTPRGNKRTRSEPEHVQDLVTPAKKDAKRKRKSELQRQRRAARSKDEKDADRERDAELERERRAARSMDEKGADRERQ